MGKILKNSQLGILRLNITRAKKHASRKVEILPSVYRLTVSGGASTGCLHQLPRAVAVDTQTNSRVHFPRADRAPSRRERIGHHLAPQGRLLPKEHRFRRSAPPHVLPKEALLAGSRHTSHLRVSTTRLPIPPSSRASTSRPWQGGRGEVGKLLRSTEGGYGLESWKMGFQVFRISGIRWSLIQWCSNEFGG